MYISDVDGTIQVALHSDKCAGVKTVILPYTCIHKLKYNKNHNTSDMQKISKYKEKYGYMPKIKDNEKINKVSTKENTPKDSFSFGKFILLNNDIEYECTNAIIKREGNITKIIDNTRNMSILITEQEHVKPLDIVLVKSDYETDEWILGQLSSIDGDLDFDNKYQIRYRIKGNSKIFRCCIPFKGNEDKIM